MTRQRLTRIVIPVATLAVTAAALIAGAAWMTRGPGTHFDPTHMPEMVGPVGAGDALWVQRHEVTVAEWNACHDAGGCALWLRTPEGEDPARTPATGLSYPDTQAYVAWLNETTGHAFRLPHLAEWRALAAPVLPEDPGPLFSDPALDWASRYQTAEEPPRALRPSGSFSTTEGGIADLDGPVWEWTADCYAGSGARDPDRCPAYWVAGLHDAAIAYQVRDPARGGCAVGTPPAHLGMRLFSDKAPMS